MHNRRSRKSRCRLLLKIRLPHLLEHPQQADEPDFWQETTDFSTTGNAALPKAKADISHRLIGA